jgi:MOSC domain
VPEIVQLLVSRVHRFEGRPSQGPLPEPDGELVEQVEIRAGVGIVGDRYFAQRAHRDAAVTMMAEESLVRARTLMAPAKLPADLGLRHTRRNVLLRGVDVDSLLGAELTLDSGSGPVTFAVHRAAHPCAWMDVTIGGGAWRALRGKGGVRCEPLTDGVLRVGLVVASVSRSA